MMVSAATPPTGRYWVIGGKHLDTASQRRRWSEVLGPYSAREEAETMRQRMDGIYAGDPQVWFRVVQDADHGG